MFLLLLLRLDSLGITQYRKYTSSTADENEFSITALKSLTGVYLRGSKVLDKIVRLLCKTGALSILSSGGGPSPTGKGRGRKTKSKTLV